MSGPASLLLGAIDRDAVPASADASPVSFLCVDAVGERSLTLS